MYFVSQNQQKSTENQNLGIPHLSNIFYVHKFPIQKPYINKRAFLKNLLKKKPVKLADNLNVL